MTLWLLMTWCNNWKNPPPIFPALGFFHLKNFKIKPSPGFLQLIFLVKFGTLPLHGKTLPIDIMIL